jgi:hypothetical protein
MRLPSVVATCSGVICPAPFQGPATGSGAEGKLKRGSTSIFDKSTEPLTALVDAECLCAQGYHPNKTT